MKARSPTLRGGLTQALVILVVLSMLASGTLVVITSVLHDTTQTLSASVETVRIAEEAQRGLLLHARARDGIGRSEVASELRSRVFEARHYITSPEENSVLHNADQRVAAYLQAVDERERDELEPPAYEALGDLVRLNLAQTAEAQMRAGRLDTVANAVGFATALAVIVGAVALGWWVRVCALRPVLGLARSMKSFGLGNETERAPENGPEELREMARQFNEMADRLADQKTAHRTYLAGIAHDVRNPLGTLCLAVDAFSTEGPIDQDRLRRVLGIVRRQIDRLTRLAEDLLDTANLEAGRLELHIGAHDLREVARSTVELFAASSARHDIELAVPEEAAVVACDAHRIEQALANLVGNAIKYSPKGGKVCVSVDAKRDVVEICVEDRGVGMTPEEIEQSFQAFTRAATLKDAVPGHGLGLFISQRIVEEHGGAMSVDSVPGQGSVFRIALPRTHGDVLEHPLH